MRIKNGTIIFNPDDRTGNEPETDQKQNKIYHEVTLVWYQRTNKTISSGKTKTCSPTGPVRNFQNFFGPVLVRSENLRGCQNFITLGRPKFLHFFGPAPVRNFQIFFWSWSGSVQKSEFCLVPASSCPRFLKYFRTCSGPAPVKLSVRGSLTLALKV